MPPPITAVQDWRTPSGLVEIAAAKAWLFCRANKIPFPVIAESDDPEMFGACAYYRPQTIYISLRKCARLAPHNPCRNWNWPGTPTDREPYGVVCHELGHHCDWIRSEKKGNYYGGYSINLRRRSGERELTSYCPNDAEWFAEMFRLFVTSHALLRELRPHTFRLLAEDWKPISDDNWLNNLGPVENVPERIITNIRKKIAK